MARIIVFFSTKGGVGKTLIAANIAVALGKEQGKRVCLLDLDLQAPGDMARMLDIASPKSMVDMMAHLKAQPGTLKKYEYVVKTVHGIDFLTSMLKPQQAAQFDTTGIREVITVLSRDYDYIVIDAGKSFNENFIAALNQANLILLVTTPDILSVYQTKWAMDTLQFLHFPLSMVKLVLNRAESASSIGWQDIKTNLQIDVIAQVPSEGKIVGYAVNRRVPVFLDSPRSKFSVSISKLCQQLVTEPKLYIEHRELDSMRVKEARIDKAGDFWTKQGMAEGGELVIFEETDEVLMLKRRIHSRLIEELDLKRLDLKVFSDTVKRKELRDKAQMLVTNLLSEEAGSFISSVDERRKLVKEILDEALGLGPLEDLLSDVSITDIMVNNKDEIYVERFGKLEVTNKRFISNEQVKVIIERIIAPIGRRIDESVPMVDARLPDGSRVNAIIPPLSLRGPTLTIRKFRKERFKTEELIGFHSLSQYMADFIRAAVLCRKNVIVSGGTGSGKTTILNVLSAFIPNYERIITIEDAAELRLHQEHWLRLESRPPNIEGKGAITIRDLFRNTLRMRPDRIIIGECRGIETLDMLQAMNTGHDGSMTTIHANSTQDVLARLDSMILMSGVELPIRAIREMIASAIDVIVHTARLSDGTRKIIQITELTGMKDEMHIGMKDIFMFKQTGMDAQGYIMGEFEATGYIPSFMEDIKLKGIPLPENIFRAR